MRLHEVSCRALTPPAVGIEGSAIQIANPRNHDVGILGIVQNLGELHDSPHLGGIHVAQSAAGIDLHVQVAPQHLLHRGQLAHPLKLARAMDQVVRLQERHAGENIGIDPYTPETGHIPPVNRPDIRLRIGLLPEVFTVMGHVHGPLRNAFGEARENHRRAPGVRLLASHMVQHGVGITGVANP